MALLRFHTGRTLQIGTGCSAGGFLAFTSGETSKSGGVINLQKDAITLIETQIIIAHGEAVKPQHLRGRATLKLAGESPVHRSEDCRFALEGYYTFSATTKTMSPRFR
jgi:hypothetical protein